MNQYQPQKLSVLSMLKNEERQEQCTPRVDHLDWPDSILDISLSGAVHVPFACAFQYPAASWNQGPKKKAKEHHRLCRIELMEGNRSIDAWHQSATVGWRYFHQLIARRTKRKKIYRTNKTDFDRVAISALKKASTSFECSSINDSFVSRFGKYVWGM